MRNIFTSLIVIICISCGNEPIPKPKAFLRLEYPKPIYKEINSNNLPFTFAKNSVVTNIKSIKASGDKKTIGLDLEYPSLKATIYLTYKAIDRDNFKIFLKDAKNITQSHAKKAEAIVAQPYSNFKHLVYGTLYEIEGNVASQSQFYVTDSINHFLTGSLYFFVKPNHDSILPAVNYINKDIRHLMETIKWK